ncbi:hypothetical protein B7P43_G04694 [Cryptotermes secundus]|uniref:Tc1-like transposase DDE domain-containing protein n=1 Tax=Cryptotermes secundus TaxID=105785 RepID=A0A2J7QFC1_9NEOP|nr:hypothetical protein B7P43_G04694 [Cryptotermes secundus]
MAHAPYSPDLAPNDYHVFGPLKKFLAGQRFISEDNVKTTVQLVTCSIDQILQQCHLQTSGAM